MRSSNTPRIDGLALVALALMFFMLIKVISDQPDGRAVAAAPPEATATPVDNPDEVLPPYLSYILTQGPHGQSYGQLAIDLTAGKGAAVLSPINGVVTALYVDGLGNTTLIIENDHFQVTLLHGQYSVQVGDRLSAGQPVGVESNQGNTVDARGISCRGRDCGYHTHLNIFDKSLSANVNPLDLFPK